jgi:hypothetical protein
MRPSAFAAGLPLALLLSACAALSANAPKSVATAGPPAIPWIDTKPAGPHGGLATPLAGSRPRTCQATDLRAGWGGTTGPAGGRVSASIQFINQSTTDCVIAGVPTVQLMADTGAISLTQATIDSVPVSDVVMLPSAGALVAGRSGEAFTKVEWRVTDAGTSTCLAHIAKATAMEVFLAARSEPISVDDFADRGAAPAAICPPQLGVGAVQASLNPNSTSLTPRYWKATLDVPPTAKLGSALVYQVMLQNVYYRPLEFRRGCPGYIETLLGPRDWTSGKVWFVLNCQGVGVLAPGASVTFAMRMEIPRTAPPGKYILAWELDTGLNSYGSSDASVTVTAS